MQKTNKAAAGFTLIELVFAMAGFTMMLVIAVSGFLNATWIYNQANVSRDNQQQVRRVMEQIGAEIRTASVVSADSTDGVLCIGGSSGNKLYKIDGSSPNKRLMLYQLQPKNALPVNCADESTYALSASGNSLMPNQTLEDFKPELFVQNPGSQAYGPTQTVRVAITVSRGDTTSARSRQFSNTYGLRGMYLVRGAN